MEGKYAQSWGVIVIVGGIGLLFLAAGIYFLFGGNMDIFYYPLLTGLVTLLVTAVFVMRQGKFSLSEVALEGKRRSGKPWSYPLDEVGEVKISLTHTDIYGKNNKRLQSLLKVSPERASGALWMYLFYRDKLPAAALAQVGQKYKKKKLPEGLSVAQRTFRKPGSPTLDDWGTVARYGDKYFYIPETRTDSSGGTINVLSPVVITRYVETPGIPNRMYLPIFPVVRDLHASSTLSEEDKKGYLGLLAMTHLGSLGDVSELNAEGIVQKTLEDGTELTITLRQL